MSGGEREQRGIWEEAPLCVERAFEAPFGQITSSLPVGTQELL